ncbi:flavodoxin [Eubacteriaceae bacterium ES2]|nr:flavodoxin [Eubacteriaceae bacterium ES2]
MSKSLVVYFSVYGTAKNLAKEIAVQTHSDILEIEPEIAYDGNRAHYDTLAELAKSEHDNSVRPMIKNTIKIGDYDNIFVGYPIWYYTFPMIMYTFFEEYEFNGKTIIPFNTHMGSGEGGTYKIIKKLLPNATVLPGLPIKMKTAEKGASREIEKWLRILNLLQD